MFCPMDRILLSLLAILIYKVEVVPTLCSCDPATTIDSAANCSVTVSVVPFIGHLRCLFLFLDQSNKDKLKITCIT